MRQRYIAGVSRCRRNPNQSTIRLSHPDGPVRRGFTATAPGQLFVGDITDLPTKQGWRYRRL
ncbi:hypothetical protein ACFOZ4_00050 [Hamadaea flava]|uniref:Uncharacterized protein n=1 Tax=Hamadaea flava TaxID=1742688 RepID=A0ABV8LE38_9ACTN